MVEKFDTLNHFNKKEVVSEDTIFEIIGKINEIIDYKSDVDELTLAIGEYFLSVHELMDIKDKKIEAVRQQKFVEAGDFRDLENEKSKDVSLKENKISEVLKTIKENKNANSK